MNRIGLSVAVLLGLVIGAANAEESRRPKPTLTPWPAATGEASSAPAARVSPNWGSLPKPAKQMTMVPSQDGEHRHTRLVYGLKNAPASELANTLTTLFQAEAQGERSDAARRVVIVPDVLSNSLILSGSPEVVSEVQRLAEQLDRPAVMVRLEFVLVRLPAGDKPAGKGSGTKRSETLDRNSLPEQSEIVVRGELTTLDNQKARLLVGRNEPRITSSNVTTHGAAVNSITYRNTGTTLSMTPRVAADRTVALAVEVEDSRSGPIEEGTPITVPSQGEPTRVPNDEMFSTQTTVQIADGKTATVAGMGRDPKSRKQYLLLLTPHILSMSGQAANSGAKPK